MIYKAFQDLQLSQLGFGTMRLPLREDKSIDEELTAAMTDAAIRQGVNYFDTAWSYHSGKSETVIGKILQNYPRESFYLADKFPGHQIAPTYDVADIFERQLKKCGVEYFDFYLLHNVYENSIGVYEDARWNIIPYLLEQKKMAGSGIWASPRTRGCPRWSSFCSGMGRKWSSVRSSSTIWTGRCSRRRKNASC